VSWIIKQDGQTKNDCERNAKRFFEQLRKDHPHLKLILNEDALSPNAPHIRDLKKYNLHYLALSLKIISFSLILFKMLFRMAAPSSLKLRIKKSRYNTSFSYPE